MRKKYIKSLAQLKDSSLLFEKDLPPFGYILVALTAVLLQPYYSLFLWVRQEE